MILTAVTRRLFWFHLVDNKNGQPYMGTRVSAVSLEPINVIDEFKKAVQASFADSHLKHVDAPDLDVYKNKVAFEKRNAKKGKDVPLKPSLLLDDLGSKGEDPLLVAVPDFIPIQFRGIVQSAPPCKDQFYNMISKAEERDRWIHFPTNIPMLDLITNRIYVRKSYETIADAILKGDWKRSIVTGTPGIGKSIFLIYLLWRLVRENKRVFFLYDLDYIYYDGQGQILHLDKVPLESENDFHDFWTMDLWCLFDGKLGNVLLSIPSDLCKTTLSTYPRRDLTKEFEKASSTRTFYMPIWSEDEMRTASCMYPHAVDWYERFTYLGGIPRLVLEITKDDPSRIINQACSENSLSDCLNSYGPRGYIGERTKSIHCLLHINSSNPYDKPSVVFASREALDMIINENEDDFNADPKSFVGDCEDDLLAAAFCEGIFERYAIAALENGGNFTYRRLEHTMEKVAMKNETLIIPPSKKQIVDGVLDIQESYQLYVPKSKTYKGIDAWMLSIGGFQITIASSHPIKSALTKDVKLPDKKLYWVLPAEKYPTFDHKALPNVEQFALLSNNPPFFP